MLLPNIQTRLANNTSWMPTRPTWTINFLFSWSRTLLGGVTATMVGVGWMGNLHCEDADVSRWFVPLSLVSCESGDDLLWVSNKCAALNLNITEMRGFRNHDCSTKTFLQKMKTAEKSFTSLLAVARILSNDDSSEQVSKGLLWCQPRMSSRRSLARACRKSTERKYVPGLDWRQQQEKDLPQFLKHLSH